MVNLSINIFDMSVEEMKKEAISKINALKDEAALKEILDHLLKLSKGENYILSGQYESIKEKYSAVLKRLAE